VGPLGRAARFFPRHPSPSAPSPAAIPPKDRKKRTSQSSSLAFGVASPRFLFNSLKTNRKFNHPQILRGFFLLE
jgi:hypothetical protein